MPSPAASWPSPRRSTVRRVGTGRQLVHLGEPGRRRWCPSRSPTPRRPGRCCAAPATSASACSPTTTTTCAPARRPRGAPLRRASRVHATDEGAVAARRRRRRRSTAPSTGRSRPATTRSSCSRLHAVERPRTTSRRWCSTAAASHASRPTSRRPSETKGPAMTHVSSAAAPEAVTPPSARRVALASAVGATIEWYDFFLYGTAAGLVFDKLFFNGLDGPAAQFAAFGTFAVGFLARPVGGLHLRPLRRPDRPQEDAAAHAGDHGRRHGGDRAAAVVRRDRRVGADPAGRAAGPPGHRRRR